MNSSFDFLGTAIAIAFAFMMWKSSSHPSTPRFARISMRVVVALIAFAMLWNLFAVGL